MDDDLTGILVGLGGAIFVIYGGQACCTVCASGLGGGYSVTLRNAPANPEKSLASSLQLALNLPQQPKVVKLEQPGEIVVTLGDAAQLQTVTAAAGAGSLQLFGVTVTL